MAFLSPADLQTHIYAELITEITRTDASLAPRAIDAAIAEAKSYLRKYDLVKLFGDVANAATVVDENLKNKVKDLACWHLIKLSNPNIDLALFRSAYEDALKWLEKIAKGLIDPDGWIYKPIDVNTGFPKNASVYKSSNSKRSNHY